VREWAFLSGAQGANDGRAVIRYAANAVACPLTGPSATPVRASGVSAGATPGADSHRGFALETAGTGPSARGRRAPRTRACTTPCRRLLHELEHDRQALARFLTADGCRRRWQELEAVVRVREAKRQNESHDDSENRRRRAGGRDSNPDRAHRSINCHRTACRRSISFLAAPTATVRFDINAIMSAQRNQLAPPCRPGATRQLVEGTSGHMRFEDAQTEPMRRRGRIAVMQRNP
jgi:hypothetical protein